MQHITNWYVYATVSILLILTWRGSKPDHQGASSRARLLHCTPLGLTPAIIPNANNSTVQFLVAGTCVRASPLQTNIKLISRMFWTIHWGTPYTYIRIDQSFGSPLDIELGLDPFPRGIHIINLLPWGYRSRVRSVSAHRTRVRSVPARGLPRVYLLPRGIGLGLDPFPRGIYLGFICFRGVLS